MQFSVHIVRYLTVARAHTKIGREEKNCKKDFVTSFETSVMTDCMSLLPLCGIFDYKYE